MKGRPLSVLCLIIVGILFILAACGLPLEAELPDTDAADIYAEKNLIVTLTGRVRQSEIQEEFAYILIDDAVLFGRERNYKIHHVKVYLTTLRRYAAGSSLCLRGKLKRIKGPTNHGEFDRELYYRVMGVRYTLKDPEIAVTDPDYNVPLELLAMIRGLLKARVRAVYPEDVRGVVSSMLIGDKSMLDERIKARFRIGGISHMMVISGLHVTFLAGAVYEILKRLRVPIHREGKWRIAPLRDATCMLVSMGMLVLYAAVTGFSVSTVRAVIMHALVLGAKLSHRTYDLPTAMSCAMILLLMDNPLYLLYAGFQLSFLAVLGIHLVQGRSRLVSGMIFVLITLPVVLCNYFEMPLYGAVVNVLVIPCMPVLLGIIIVGLPGGAFALPAALFVRGLTALLDGVAALPYASIIMGKPGKVQIAAYAALLIIFLYASDRCRTVRSRIAVHLLVPIMVVVLGFHARTGLEIHFLDVGQGDCIVLKARNGAAIAVDGGSTSVTDVGAYRILPFLESEGIRRLDYLFLTHMDEDHIGGMREILEKIANRETPLRVDTVVLPYLTERDETYQGITELARRAGARVAAVSAGDAFACGDLTMTVLGPEPKVETSPVEPNAQCIVLAVTQGEFDCLLTGDVVGAGEENLLGILERADKKFEVLKVAHHGSKYSTPEEFLRVTWPEVSVISCGADNRYGHPHAALLRRLRGCGTRIYRTDTAGEIVVTVNRDGYCVKAFAGE